MRDTHDPIRVLILEDSEADAELVVAELRRAGIVCVCDRVTSRPAFIEALKTCHPDVVLADHGVAQYSSLRALADVHEIYPAAGFIMVSGAIDEQVAVQAIRAGADDVVAKHHIARVPSAVRGAIVARKKLRTLSDRQLLVLRLIARGLTTDGIAKRLRISRKTAETHRTNLMRRLDVHDIAHLVRYAIKLGLL